jgi:pimeloyl-ACP methyl ester carboxylesterase
MPVDLNVLRWGSGDRRALLIHGINSSAATWWQIADRLADELALAALAPDLRGHGQSPRARRYGAADYAGDLLALGSGWDLVIGHSLGGLIAAHAAQDASWARRLVLLDPVLDIPDDELAEVTRSNLDEVLEPASAAALQRANPRWHPEDAVLKARALRDASPHVTERTMRDNAPWHHAGLARALAVPTLILGSDERVFAMFAPALGATLSGDNPRVRYRTIAGAGHSIQRDDPDPMLAAARESLD